MTVEQPCTKFVADTGGAHRWCRTCGWQASHHVTPTEGQTSLFGDLVTAPTAGDLPDTPTETRDS